MRRPRLVRTSSHDLAAVSSGIKPAPVVERAHHSYSHLSGTYAEDELRFHLPTGGVLFDTLNSGNLRSQCPHAVSSVPRSSSHVYLGANAGGLQQMRRSSHL